MKEGMGEKKVVRFFFWGADTPASLPMRGSLKL